MTTRRSAVFLCAVLLVLALAGCAHQPTTATPTPPAPLDVRIAQYNQILATANNGMVTVVTSLRDAGIITAQNAQKLATYQLAVAKATKGIAEILQAPGSLADKAQMAEKLLLLCVPPPGWQAFGAKDQAQYQALVTAVDAMQSTIKLIIQLAREAS